MEGLAELRVKESDRLAAIAEGLNSCGIETEIDGDSLIVAGTGGSIPGGGRVEAKMDHRIAMSFLIMGLAAQAPVTIDDATHIGTSFPGFVELMTNLGASIGVAGRD
jgi:3-phosphoshikimate 1-carboxyvinyltransferase